MEGVYHVMSRVVDRRMVFGEEEKRHFVRLMKAYAGFSGIRLLSWCVMDNHFHLLVAVPPKRIEGRGGTVEPAGVGAAKDAGTAAVGISEQVVLQRMALIYCSREMKEFRRMLDACGAEQGRHALLRPYILRMEDLGQFMKALKQRFSQWFNRRHSRTGTLWEDRYRSTIVECEGSGRRHAARVVAAYIDLNPVRAGIVEDPKDFAWSGYGAAVRGDLTARAGLRSLWGKGSAESMAAHRVMIFEEGSEDRVPESGEKAVRKGIDARRVWAERQRGGRLPLEVMLRLRVRYWTCGAVVGTREFIERVTLARDGRAHGGVAMRFGNWGGLHSLRNLRVRVVDG